ncbi:MAG: hypothetical protein L0177_14340 [Chloroflexi bacterium]|nr:hypothetical protein [Chloroflexota bacterium]
MRVAELYYEDIEIGDDIGPIERVVTDEQVLEFQAIRERDSQPSRFTDDAIARSEGLPGAIVPGAMNIAMLSQLITGWSPSVALKKIDVVFRQVVLHNRPLRVQGVVTDKAIVGGAAQVECDVYIENEQGARLVIGKAIVALPKRAA